MRTHHRFRGYIILGTVIGLIFLLNQFVPLDEFLNPTLLREHLRGLGIAGYALFLLLMILSIPLPIPSTPVVLAGGYVYGLLGGTILALIGGVIGSFLAFYLARRVGREEMEKWIEKHHMKHFEHVFARRGPSAALIGYAIPIFPADVLSSLLGLTRISLHTFFFLVIVGHIPRYFIMNALGSDLYTGFSLKTVIVLVIATIFVLIAIFREKIKKLLFKELHELEDEVEVVEEEVGIKRKRKKRKKK